MDFQPAVSIMSAAWLKTEVLTTVTHFVFFTNQMHKCTAEKSRQGRTTAEEQLSIIRLRMPVRMPLERSSRLQCGYINIITRDMGCLFCSTQYQQDLRYRNVSNTGHHVKITALKFLRKKKTIKRIRKKLEENEVSYREEKQGKR